MKQKKILILCLLLALLVIGLCIWFFGTDSPKPTDAPTEGSPSTNAPTDPPTEPAPLTISLVGTWTGVRRDGNELNTFSFVFAEDGTGFTGSSCYQNRNLVEEYNPDCEADEAGWYLAPMGYPRDHFTYTLENGVLSITYTGCDGEDYKDFTETFTLLILGDDLISLGDREGSYTCKDLTLKELCALMDVDYTAN